MPSETSSAPKRLWQDVHDGTPVGIPTLERRWPQQTEYIRTDAADAYAQGIRDQLGAEAGALVREIERLKAAIHEYLGDEYGANYQAVLLQPAEIDRSAATLLSAAASPEGETTC